MFHVFKVIKDRSGDHRKKMSMRQQHYQNDSGKSNCWGNLFKVLTYFNKNFSIKSYWYCDSPRPKITLVHLWDHNIKVKCKNNCYTQFSYSWGPVSYYFQGEKIMESFCGLAHLFPRSNEVTPLSVCPEFTGIASPPTVLVRLSQTYKK